MNLSVESLAKFASAYAGFVFGLYWIPLRALQEAGIPGVWATVALNAVPFACTMLAILARSRTLRTAGIRFHIGSVTLGLAYTFYASAFLFTQVINVIILFYLLPLWGFILTRIVIGERITPIRWVSMALGFSGIITILGVEQGMPLPENSGDWMALVSGFLWAGGSLLVLLDQQNTAFDFGLMFVFWGTVCAAVGGIVLSAIGMSPLPDPTDLGGVAVWLIPVGLLIVLPGAFATIFGPTVLNPGVVGLLFMTEISVGTTTAALLTDEPFGPRQIAGVVVISIAGVLETAWSAVRRLRRESTF
jgi:drug/metabolite transporter (DMT)-like permease